MENQRPTPRRSLWLRPFIIVGVASLAVIALLIWQVPGLFQAPPRALIGGPFALTDSQGKPVTDATYRGKLMLVYFGYTFCPDVCPTTLAEIGQALDKLKPDQQAQLAPLFITIDPERDNVQQMAGYVKNFSPLLIGLTGSSEEITKAEKEYRVYAKKAGEGKDYSMDHSSIVYLMGRDGNFRGLLNGSATTDEIEALIRKNL